MRVLTRRGFLAQARRAVALHLVVLERHPQPSPHTPLHPMRVMKAAREGSAARLHGAATRRSTPLMVVLVGEHFFGDPVRLDSCRKAAINRNLP